jgi:hypothetical protein
MTIGEAHMFRDFTVPLWRIFGGNLLMIVTIMCYIVWWTVTFRPNSTGKTAWAGFLITLALLTGLASIAILFSGTELLSQAGKGFTIIYCSFAFLWFMRSFRQNEHHI